MHKHKIGLAVAVVAVLLTAGTALAAKPNSSFSLVLLPSAQLSAAAVSETRSHSTSPPTSRPGRS